MSAATLLSVDDLVIGFPRAGGWARAVDRVSLAVGPGERVGLVGASGSGKSLTALAVLGLVPEPGVRLGGAVRVVGVDPFSACGPELARVRGGEVGLVLQEPAEALNPVFSVSFQLVETLRIHRRLGRAEAREEALRLLARLRLEPVAAIARAYPHQLSGGQAQRVMLALALAGRPRLLVADEPTSALDVTTQAGVLDLLRRTCDEDGLALLLVGHDLAVVTGLADRLLVMLAGELVEVAPTADLLEQPLHPYTRLLLASRPEARTPSAAGSGPLPALGPHLPGCRFAPACPLAQPSCRSAHPELVAVTPRRLLRCPVVSERQAGSASVPPEGRDSFRSLPVA